MSRLLLGALSVSLLVASPAHAAAATADTVLVWGSDSGQTAPTAKASLPDGATWSVVDTGAAHALALTSSGEVYAWGDNQQGQLGIDPATTIYSATPVHIAGLPSGVTAIAAANDYNVAVAGGKVYVWGQNDYGQLGSDPALSTFSATPQQVPGLTDVVSVSAGAIHVLALTSAHTVFAWGWDGSGEFCDGHSGEPFAPHQVDAPPSGSGHWVQVGGGNQFTLLRTDTGRVFACGYGYPGGLGNGDQASKAIPTPVSLPAGAAASDISASEENGYAVVSTDGGLHRSLLSWGRNDVGQIGNPDFTDVVVPSPVTVSLPAGVEPVDVEGADAAVGTFAYVIDGQGKLWGWGNDGNDQLGDGGAVGSSIATPISVPLAAGTVLFAVAGNNGGGLALPLPPATAPALTAATPPATAKAGQSYGPYTFTASGFPAPTFTVGSGALPPGLNLHASGLLDGTPTAAGHYTFTVTATNSAGTDTSALLTIDVPVPPHFTASSPPTTGTVGTPYAGYTFAATGTGGTTAFGTSGAVPPGLVVDSSTGSLSGTPTAGGSYDFAVTATDTNGTAVAPFTFAIGQPPQLTAATPPSAVTKGVAMTPYHFVATGYPAPSFSIASGALPSGVVLDADGTLHGTATSTGDYTYSVQAANRVGTPATTASLSLQVREVPTLPDGDKTLADGTRGQPYSVQFHATGHPAPTYTICGAARPHPPGMTMDASGLFHGTPAGQGSQDFDVCLSNTAGSTFPITVHWHVVDATPPVVTITAKPAQFSTSSAPHFTVTVSDADDTSTAIGEVVAVLDGTSGGGQLQNGTFTNAVSAAPGPHTIVFSAADPYGNVGTASYSWTVDITAPTASIGNLPTFTLAETVPLKFTGTDPKGSAPAGSGVASYDVRTRTARYTSAGGGAWTAPAAWQDITTTTVTANLTPGYTSCFSVRSTDKAGNTSPWSADECTSQPLDDRRLSSSAGWTDGNGSGYYENTFTSAKRQNEKLTLSGVRGSTFGVFAYTCVGCGRVAIFVDGVKQRTWNLDASSAHKKVLLTYQNPDSGSAVSVSLRVVSDTKLVRLDGFGVMR